MANDGHPALNWAKRQFGRSLTKTELLGSSLVASSMVTGLFAAGLGSSALWLFAGASFVIGDVLFLIGSFRADW